MNDEILVPESTLREFAHELLVGAGVPPSTAAAVVDGLVYADLRGIDSHGVHLLSLYLARLARGELEPEAEVTVVEDRGSTVLLDGGLGFGQVAGVAAVEHGVRRAADSGISLVCVREATHLGALGYYTGKGAGEGVMALAFQNGPPFVPPFGGLDPLFSTNPFSYAVPTGEEPLVVYDVATTAVAGNKVLLAQKRGDPTIPEGWANDEHGRPTTDTAKASVHHLQWFGGHKGFGLALLVEAMAGVLADSCYGTTENTRSTAHGQDRVAKGCAFLFIDPEQTIGRAEFVRRTDSLVREIRSNPPADGVEQVMVPGELEWRRLQERSTQGIPLPHPLVDELDALAQDHGVTPLTDHVATGGS